MKNCPDLATIISYSSGALSKSFALLVSSHIEKCGHCKKNIDRCHEMGGSFLEETENKISIEAGTTDCWTKYIGNNGIAFGVNNFGKSAPYKDIFKDFKLTLEDIVNSTKKMINKN